MPKLPTLFRTDWELSVCRLPPGHRLPDSFFASPAPFLSVTRTGDELSVVCPRELAPADARREDDWGCFRVEGTLDFALTGILAALLGPLADAGISAFAVSTYDTDYLLVRQAKLAEATAALRAAGYAVAP